MSDIRTSSPPTTEPLEAAPAVLPPIGWQAPALDLLATLVRRKRLFLGIVGAALAVCLALLLTTPPWYRAGAVAMLLAREKPAVDVALRIGSVQTGLAGAQRDETGTLMLPRDAALYIAIARSRPVRTALAERFATAFRETYGEEVLDARLRRLEGMVDLSGDETGMFTVEVVSIDPRLAADLANAVVAEMDLASRGIEARLITQQSRFLERALARFERDLREAESDLRQLQSKHGVVNLSAQADDVLSRIRLLHLEKLELERQLIERRESFTEDDPRVQSLLARVQKCDDDIARARTSYLGRVHESDVGELQLRHEELRTRLRFRRDLVATLRGQREIFAMRRDQPTGSIAVLREATAPTAKSGPRRKAYLSIALALGLLCGVVLSLLAEQAAQAQRDPYLSTRLDEIRSGLAAPKLVERWQAWRDRRRDVGP